MRTSTTTRIIGAVLGCLALPCLANADGGWIFGPTTLANHPAAGAISQQLPELKGSRTPRTLPLSLNPLAMDPTRTLGVSGNSGLLGAFDITATPAKTTGPAHGSDQGPLVGGLFLARHSALLDRGWQIENTFGDQHINTNKFVASGTRLSLPTVPMRGYSGAGADSDTQVNWAIGQAGWVDHTKSFASNDGAIGGLGVNQKLASRWEVGAQVWNAWDESEHSRGSVAGALRYMDERASYAFHTALNDSERWGVWFNTELTMDQILHRFGVYRITPELSWAGRSIANDRQGLYWAAERKSEHWSWKTGVETEQTNLRRDATHTGTITARTFGNVTQDLGQNLAVSSGFRTEVQRAYANLSGTEKEKFELDLSLQRPFWKGSGTLTLAWSGDAGADRIKSVFQIGWEQQWLAAKKKTLRSRIDLRRRSVDSTARYLPSAGILLTRPLGRWVDLSGSLYYAVDTNDVPNGMRPQNWCIATTSCVHGAGGSVWLGVTNHPHSGWLEESP